MTTVKKARLLGLALIVAGGFLCYDLFSQHHPDSIMIAVWSIASGFGIALGAAFVLVPAKVIEELDR